MTDNVTLKHLKDVVVMKQLEEVQSEFTAEELTKEISDQLGFDGSIEFIMELDAEFSTCEFSRALIRQLLTIYLSECSDSKESKFTLEYFLKEPDNDEDDK